MEKKKLRATEGKESVIIDKKKEEQMHDDAWRHRCGEIKKIRVEKPKTNTDREEKMNQMWLYCHYL